MTGKQGRDVRRPLGRRVLAGFGLALALLCVIEVVSYRSIAGLIDNGGRVAHTQEVLAVLADTLLSVVNAETGGRGFLVTRADRYLEPYNAALEEIDQNLRRLRRLTADNPAQQQRLDALGPLVARRLEVLRAMIDAERMAETTTLARPAAQLALHDEGRELMDEIRALMLAMEAEERGLLAQRAAEARASARWTIGVLGVSGALAFASVLGAVALVYRDITSRARDEVALRDYADEIEDLYDRAPCGYHSLDANGIFLRVNATELEWLGYRRDELVGKVRFTDLCTPEGRLLFAQQFPLFKERGWVSDLEFELRRSDGSYLQVALSATAVRDADGNYLMSRSTLTDVTARRRAEREVRELNVTLARRAAELEATNHELEAFSYSVSHDLRAPLRSIDGFSQALLEDYGEQLDAVGRDYLSRVRGASQRMGLLIDDMLQLSRVTRSELRREAVDLSALARQVAADLRQREPERSVTVTIADGIVAQGDAHLLGILLENLLGNAWKFTAGAREPTIVLGVDAADGERAYFVRDNGVGFDMAYADKLFVAFQRLHAVTEFPGTGIGLATVQRIVHRHGGRVWARGAVNQGATFWFTLDAV